MKVDGFDFELPPERIALRPVRPRDSARLLVVNNGELQDQRIHELKSLLSPGDILVINNTRVIPGRLRGRRGAAMVNATLLKMVSHDTWHALARPGRKFRPGDRIVFAGGLAADVRDNLGGGEVILLFNSGGIELHDILEKVGDMPLPPYIAARRAPDARDHEDYQTIFGHQEGAVAAPTAGLHFSHELLTQMEQKGIDRAEITLHVGAGTFLPIKSADTDDHSMHAEIGIITEEAAQQINAARQAGGRVVAVGTTALRLLESAADENGSIRAFSGETDLFITPGYTFKAVDLLMTNFHLPKSTLFMLVCAFAGTATMKAAYRHAIHTEYRFYSYGDGSLLYPDGLT